MATKDSACLLYGCGGGAHAHGGDAGYDAMDTQRAFKGNRGSGGGGPRPPAQQAAGSAANWAVYSSSCAGAVVAQRALLASSRRRVGGGRRTGGDGTKSTVPSRLSRVSAAEDAAGSLD